MTKEERREYNKAYRLKNKEAIAKKAQKYYLENKERIKETHRIYETNNRVAVLERKKSWRKNNKDYMPQWFKDNHAKKMAYEANRRSRKLKQTPEDADLYKILEFYKEAQQLTVVTNIQHHVDHVIPLSKGGLHHQDNLQILTAEENLRKGSKVLKQTNQNIT